MIAGYYVTDEPYKVEEECGTRTEYRFLKNSDDKWDSNYTGFETRKIDIATGETREIRCVYFDRDLPF